MKEKFILGLTLFVSGALLFGIMHLAIAMYIPSMTEWADPLGKFQSVLTQTMGWFPYIFSIILMVAGIILLIIHFKKDWLPYIEKWEANDSDKNAESNQK